MMKLESDLHMLKMWLLQLHSGNFSTIDNRLGLFLLDSIQGGMETKKYEGWETKCERVVKTSISPIVAMGCITEYHILCILPHAVT